jgi:predicted AAA+ superfamily ATPase
MFHRKMLKTVEEGLSRSPAVVLLGPRQTGKTTLAKAVGDAREAVYLDLERPSDLAKLSDAESFLTAQAPKLVILDEVQRVPSSSGCCGA